VREAGSGKQRFLQMISKFHFLHSRSSAHQTFESTSGEAAILTMPDGASTQNLLATLQIHQCISENAQNWYEYARNERSRAVNNGDIRVVIGIDKVKSWGIATSTCNSGETASLTFKQDRSLNRIRYGWDCTGGSGRVGPAEIEINDLIQNNTIPENQCVFVRTMNFTLSGEIWYDFSSQAVVQPGPLSGQGDSVSANRGRSEGNSIISETHFESLRNALETCRIFQRQSDISNVLSN
jgi:hypothetical protein